MGTSGTGSSGLPGGVFLSIRVNLKDLVCSLISALFKGFSFIFKLFGWDGDAEMCKSPSKVSLDDEKQGVNLNISFNDEYSYIQINIYNFIDFTCYYHYANKDEKQFHCQARGFWYRLFKGLKTTVTKMVKGAKIAFEKIGDFFNPQRTTLLWSKKESQINELENQRDTQARNYLAKYDAEVKKINEEYDPKIQNPPAGKKKKHVRR